jgi:hypothetical protein
MNLYPDACIKRKLVSQVSRTLGNSTFSLKKETCVQYCRIKKCFSQTKTYISQNLKAFDQNHTRAVKNINRGNQLKTTNNYDYG